MIRFAMTVCTSLLLVSLCFSRAYSEFLVYAGELPPFHFVGEDQQIQGASIDILAEMMRLSGIRFDPKTVRHVPWARAMQETEKKAGRMLVGVARTEQREKQFKWIGPLCTLKMGLIARKARHIRIREGKNLGRFTIGVINNSAPADVLQHDYCVPDTCLVPLSDDTQQFKMLQVDHVDLITHVDIVAPFFMAQLGYDPQDYEMVYVLKQLHLYYAVNAETDDSVVARLQKSLDEMKQPSVSDPSVYDAIIRKYGMPKPLDVVSP